MVVGAVRTDSAPGLRLMAVHAHPDDESTSTGGILARYALEGVQTIVATCTNGELGDGPGGVKPGAEGHHTHQVAKTRLAELRTACQHLGVTHLELLGYHDSGIADWDHRHRPDVFCNVPIDTAAARLAQLIEHYRPQVVVTYDPGRTSQHPDHLHAARATALAVKTSGIPAKMYFTAHGTTYWHRVNQALAKVGIQRQIPDPDLLERIEQRITTTVDVSHVIKRKRTALHAHASQIGSSLAGKLPVDLFTHAFSTETYIRAHDTTGSPPFENDLFTGLAAS
ncbi:MAG: PIG-L family deacetylase [Pseudonocardiaceae bacterium]